MPRTAGKKNPNETPAQTFVRIVNIKVNVARRAIKSIGSLSGAKYLHTAEQRDKIQKAIQESLERCIQQLKTGSVSNDDFKL